MRLCDAVLLLRVLVRLAATAATAVTPTTAMTHGCATNRAALSEGRPASYYSAAAQINKAFVIMK